MNYRDPTPERTQNRVLAILRSIIQEVEHEDNWTIVQTSPTHRQVGMAFAKDQYVWMELHFSYGHHLDFICPSCAHHPWDLGVTVTHIKGPSEYPKMVEAMRAYIHKVKDHPADPNTYVKESVGSWDMMIERPLFVWDVAQALIHTFPKWERAHHNRSCFHVLFDPRKGTRTISCYWDWAKRGVALSLWDGTPRYVSPCKPSKDPDLVYLYGPEDIPTTMRALRLSYRKWAPVRKGFHGLGDMGGLWEPLRRFEGKMTGVSSQ